MSDATTQELNETISNLIIENERIKKTSKQRFDKNKKIENDSIYYKEQSRRADNVIEFLNDNGFPTKHHQGLPRFDYSVFNAIRALSNKNSPKDKPEVDGIYAVKIEGERKIVEIKYTLCWSMLDEESGKYHGIHFYDISDFTLLEHK